MDSTDFIPFYWVLRCSTGTGNYYAAVLERQILCIQTLANHTMTWNFKTVVLPAADISRRRFIATILLEFDGQTHSGLILNQVGHPFNANGLSSRQ